MTKASLLRAIELNEKITILENQLKAIIGFTPEENTVSIRFAKSTACNWHFTTSTPVFLELVKGVKSAIKKELETLNNLFEEL